MPACWVCRGSGTVLKNGYAGDIQPWDPEDFVYIDELVDGVMTSVQYEKRVPCHACSGGGPNPNPEHTLVKAGEP